MLSLVSMREIEAIFEILDRLGVSREAVVIPLRPASPGSVSRRPDGRFEIVVEAERPLADWLREVEARLVEMGAAGGSAAGRPGGAGRGPGRS